MTSPKPRSILTPEFARAELDRLEPILQDLGLRTPFRRARRLAREEQAWEEERVQACWRSRLAFWRRVLPEKGGAADWASLLDLGRPALAQIRDDLEAGGLRARTAWAQHMRRRTELRELLRDAAFAKMLFEADEWGLYDEDGGFRFERPEGLTRGEIRLLALEPVYMPPGEDHDWTLAHPRDRLFQYQSQSAYHLMYLALAHQHRPADPVWARTFVRMAAALVDQCPRLPDGLHDFGSGSTAQKPANVAWAHYGYVANRLHFLLLTYLTLADSPEFSPAFHELVLRVVAEHARHLSELGAHAFRDNYMNATAKALYLTAALLPELAGGEEGLEPMWPLLMQGIRREALPDGCHMHRSFSYHLTFVKRPLDMLLVARGIPGAPPIPGEFRAVVERATDAFARMSTPIRSTPGVNDDWTVASRFHHILAGAAGVFDRDDWRHLATDGRQGTEPAYRSALLPDAQLIAMRAGWASQDNYLFFNVSPNGGHYHPDPLSVQVWSGGDHMLIDPGVGHYYTGEREIARRSAWHNCPTLGAGDLPTDLKPKVLHWEAGDDLDYAVGQVEIPGEHAAPPTRFRRHVFFVDRGCFVIYDEFAAVPAGREVWENFHFAAPEATVDGAGGRVVAVVAEGAGLALAVASEGWALRRETASRWLGYGAPALPTTLVHFMAPAAGAGRGFAAVIAPFAAGAAPPDVRVEVAGRRTDGVVALRLTAGGRQRVLTTRVRFYTGGRPMNPQGTLEYGHRAHGGPARDPPGRNHLQGRLAR